MDYSIVLCVVVAFSVSVSARNCTYTDPASGKVYDLSPLVSSTGYYLWKIPAFVTAGNSIDTAPAAEAKNYTFQLQVCNDIPKPYTKNCTIIGAAYMVDMVTGICVTLGSSNQSAFDVSPYKDGVFLQHFHGTPTNHYAKYSFTIYFVCDQTTPLNGPHFEHMKSDPLNQAHFKIFTKYAC